MRKLLNRIAPSLWRLYAYFLDYKVTLVVATVFMVLSASTSSLTATLLGQLTDIGFSIVLKRCATIIVVRPFIKSFKASLIFSSLPRSRALVGSSKIKIGAFFKKARAIERRCF